MPVDLVTGTSMGSVVGGLYAAGLSPEELSATIQSVDWVDVFDDKTDRQDLSFRRKQDDRNFLTNLRLGFKDWSLFIPSGIVEGQKLDFLLRSMTLDRTGSRRSRTCRCRSAPSRPTSSRARPWCSTTARSRSRSARACRSRPRSRPWSSNDRVLVDGYVANNLPIDVAQELGADVDHRRRHLDPGLEARRARDRGRDPGPGRDVSGSAAQAAPDRAAEADRRAAAARPRRHRGRLVSRRWSEAIAIGREAALAKKDELARYSVSEAEYEAVARARSAGRRSSCP